MARRGKGDRPHASGGIRPWFWLIGGVVFAVMGVVCVLVAVAAVREPDDISGLPSCTSDPKADCLVERPAEIRRLGHARGAWVTGERKWLVRVDGGLPTRPAETLDDIRVPRQPGADELHTGSSIRLVYYHLRPVLVRLPSGAELETDDHPNRYAPTMGYVGVFALAMGLFSWGRGWRTGRAEGFWRKAPAHDPGMAPVIAPLFLGGGAAFVTQFLAGSHRWPGLVALLLGVGLGVLVVLKNRGRFAR